MPASRQHLVVALLDQVNCPSSAYRFKILIILIILAAFGKPAAPTVTPGFGGFGGTNFMLGQPQQQPVPISSDEAFAQSILNVSIFGDERDNIVAKWNYLQAMWGTGKLFYSQSAAPVDITQENYLCRFKAIGYSRMPGKDNKLGLVALNFDRDLATIK